MEKESSAEVAPPAGQVSPPGETSSTQNDSSSGDGSPSRAASPSSLSIDIEKEDAFKLAVRELFASCFKSDYETSDVEETSKLFRERFFDAYTEDEDQFTWNVVHLIKAINDLELPRPDMLDFMVKVFVDMIPKMPDLESSDYKKVDPETGEEISAWDGTDIAQFNYEIWSWDSMYTDCEFPDNHSATEEIDLLKQGMSCDCSEDVFSLEECLDELKVYRRQSHEIIMAAAVHGRTFALGNEVLGPCEVANANIIRDTVDRHTSRVEDEGWGALGFIASCIMLRACAKRLVETLPDGKDRVQVWKKDLVKLMMTRSEDYNLVTHAAVSKATSTSCHWPPSTDV